MDFDFSFTSSTNRRKVCSRLAFGEGRETLNSCSTQEGFDPTLQIKRENFLVVTIPKSGTHLIMKLLKMLTKKNPAFFWNYYPQLGLFNFQDEIPRSAIRPLEIQSIIERCSTEQVYPIAHTNFADLFYQFSSLHQDWIKLVVIRDLRDVFVSCAFFQSKYLEEVEGITDFDEKLKFLLTVERGSSRSSLFQIKKFAEMALKWIDDPKAIVCRFEDLIGENGGGSTQRQKQIISSIAERLSIPFDDQRFCEISNDLFGEDKEPSMNRTFRKGVIGEAKKYYSEESKQIFNERIGEIQTALGYPLF